MPIDELRLSLLELTDQLGRLLRTATPRFDPDELEHLRRARNAALVALGEARELLDGDSQSAITQRTPAPVWLPSPNMRERLHARRQLRREWRGGVDPFAEPPRPRL